MSQLNLKKFLYNTAISVQPAPYIAGHSLEIYNYHSLHIYFNNNLSVNQ